jgi:hypothetical protein
LFFQGLASSRSRLSQKKNIFSLVCCRFAEHISSLTQPGRAPLLNLLEVFDKLFELGQGHGIRMTRLTSASVLAEGFACQNEMTSGL